MKKILIVTIVILGLCVLNANIMAEPVVEEVTIDPAEPTPLSTITFNATITSEDEIDGVYLILQECKDVSLCFLRKNESMDLVDGIYQKTFQLEHEATTLIKYNLAIEIDGEWYETEITHVDLKLDSGNGNGGTTNGGDDSGNGTPGFELIPLLIAIFVGVLLLKRKRSR